jgi:glyoxylate/hydroxypyruvate reductase A
MKVNRGSALLVAVPGRDPQGLAARLSARLPGVDIRVWPELGDPTDIAFALAWRAPEPLFNRLPNLRAVVSMGAGVDALVVRGDLARNVAIGRLAGPRLAAAMAAYLVATVIGWWRNLDRFGELQRRAEWRPWAPARPPEVGLLGVGILGGKAAEAFRALDINVHGWTRSGRVPDDVTPAHGQSGLESLASRCDAVINLLPLTAQTRGLLDRKLFSAMRRDSLLVNVGRGEHLAEADLIEALNAGRPGRAVLDVFQEEPLPGDHPFWRHPRVTVTPHCASLTSVEEAADLAAESYRQAIAGKPMPAGVDRDRGY